MSINGIKNIANTTNTPHFGVRCLNSKSLLKTLYRKGGFHPSTARSIVKDLKKIGSKETVLENLSIYRFPKLGGVEITLRTGLKGDKDRIVRKSPFVTEFFDRKEFVDVSKKAIDSAEEGYIKSRVLKGAAKDAITPGELETEHASRILSYIYPDKTNYIETVYKYAKVQPEEITKAKISFNA